MRNLSKVYTPSSKGLICAEVVRLRSRPCTWAKAVLSGGCGSRAGLCRSPKRGPARLGEPPTWYPTSAQSTTLRRLRWREPSTWRLARLGEPSPFDSSTQISLPSPRSRFIAFDGSRGSIGEEIRVWIWCIFCSDLCPW
ncbi:hypothetical protein M6B38_413535 [Iris pallida]|uniref:Uncharacterized protein n=1 Tax=Iris pallida TaxID=29817 RepID=A0AAX6FLU3_IRIPA|nr:hypothetical protein M6B38_413535 [Iris pallida]